jgi:hypothetical protein
MLNRNESPMDAGRRWAEWRAESLDGDIPALDWPDEWPSAWNEALELPEEVGERDAPAYRIAAHHAAAERWAELLKEHRDSEAVAEEEADAEAQAVRLVSLLREDLPAGLTVWRDGHDVYLRAPHGEETPIHSLRDAWRVVAEYDEHYT